MKFTEFVKLTCICTQWFKMDVIKYLADGIYTHSWFEHSSIVILNIRIRGECLAHTNEWKYVPSARNSLLGLAPTSTEISWTARSVCICPLPSSQEASAVAHAIIAFLDEPPHT